MITATRSRNTQILNEPVTIEVPIQLLSMPDCPHFCNGECDTWVEEDGSGHHSSGLSGITIQGGYRGEDVVLDVSASRTDEDYQAGTPEVNFMPSRGGDGMTITPAEARKVAALLLDAADDADPLAAGVLSVGAEHVRIGDDISTPDGWQQVVGQMAFSATDACAAQVNVWTDDYDHSQDTEGWEFQPGDIVHIRRRLHGSCAIAFVEPIR